MAMSIEPGVTHFQKILLAHVVTAPYLGSWKFLGTWRTRRATWHLMVASQVSVSDSTLAQEGGLIPLISALCAKATTISALASDQASYRLALLDLAITIACFRLATHRTVPVKVQVYAVLCSGSVALPGPRMNFCLVLLLARLFDWLGAHGCS